MQTLGQRFLQGIIIYMAQVKTFKDGGRIVWGAEDFISGLATNYSNTTTDTQRGSNFLTSARAFNPFLHYGYGYPGYLSTDVSSVSEITDY